MEDTKTNSEKTELKSEKVNELTRNEVVKDTAKNEEIRGNQHSSNIQMYSKEMITKNAAKQENTSSDDSSTFIEPFDEIVKSLTSLNIYDRGGDKKTYIKGTASADAISNKTNLNIRTKLQQHFITLDSDDDSDSNNDDEKDNCANISDFGSKKVDEKEFKAFDHSQFSQILDQCMIADSEILTEAKIENNVRKTLNFFCRKFIMDAIAEERDIEMEKIPSYIYRISGQKSGKHTDFEMRFTDSNAKTANQIKTLFTKFKQQINESSTSYLSVNAVYPKNYNDIDNSKKNINDLIEVTKKGDINEVKTFIKNMNRDNVIFFSKTLMDIIPLTCKYNQHQILDHIMQELLKVKEIHQKYFAFCHALNVNDVDLLEKIYYYYSGNIHWVGTEAADMENYQENIIWNLNLLNVILCNAWTNLNGSTFNKETLYYLDSLINFNYFQVTLYTNLAICRNDFRSLDQNSHNTEMEIRALKDIILDIFKIYIFYMSKQEIKELHIQVPLEMRDVLGKNALHFNYVDNLVRELYFKRMDLNVSLILLDNLNLLEERLLMPAGFYKNVKSRLYHFIYHLSKDWSAFMPTENKESLKIPCTIDNGQSENVVYKIDVIKLSISPIIYLERKELYNCLNSLKDELEKNDIKSNVRNKSHKTSIDEHSLNIVPYVTDEVSLKKMLYYMDGLSYVDLKNDKQNGQLIILRIIQILGEFIKDTEESAHLSPETKAFLKTEVSQCTMNFVKKIRNNITHVDKAQLVAKIDVEQNENNKQLFGNVLNELKEMKCGIVNFLKIHKPRAKKASIKDALKLLKNRINEISNLKNKSPANVQEIEENGYFKQIWRTNRSSEQFEDEVRFIEINTECLLLNLKETTIYLRCCVLMKLTLYVHKIRNVLQFIKNPDKLNAENNNELYEQWDMIKEILRIIVEDADIFDNYPLYLKKGTCLPLFEYILKLPPSENSVNYVNNIIHMIIESAKTYGFDILSLDNTKIYISEKLHSGLAKLSESLTRSNFLTIMEQKAILNNVSKIMEGCKNLKDKVYENEPLSKTEYEKLLKNFKLKTKSEKHLSNLVLGRRRSLVLLECLCDRVSLLKKVLYSHCKDDKKQHLIFLKNQKYRLIVESLLLDIMNIFNDSNLKISLKKTSKFLAEVNLRNILSHGNPLLELAGDVIDATDLPVELMTRALRYARDEGSIKALTILVRQKVDPNDIIQEVKTLNKDLQNQIKEFKKSEHYQEYLELAIKDYEKEENNDANSSSANIKKVTNLSNQKTEPNDLKKSVRKNKYIELKTENELLKAVKAGNLEEVKKLNRTVANTNAADASGKGSLHYAAMKGRADMIEVLVRGSIDARCERYGRSALHYAVMNGHAVAARTLVAAGVDLTAVDKRGKTPLDYAGDDIMRSILDNEKDART